MDGDIVTKVQFQRRNTLVHVIAAGFYEFFHTTTTAVINSQPIQKSGSFRLSITKLIHSLNS